MDNLVKPFFYVFRLRHTKLNKTAEVASTSFSSACIFLDWDEKDTQILGETETEGLLLGMTMNDFSIMPSRL